MHKLFWRKGLTVMLAAVMVAACCACMQQEQTVNSQKEQPDESEASEVTQTQRTPRPVPTTPAPVVTTEPPTEGPMKQIYREDPTTFVVFSQAIEPREIYVTLEEVLAYESQYPDCNGTWYRDQLRGEDLSIYNAYMYAMEHCYTGFELYVEDKDKDFTPVRQALSLDSPFLAQNTSRYEHFYGRINYLGERIYVGIEHFSPKRWEMKMEALDECRKIVAGIPAEYSNQLEKMEYLYRYVCDHVEYVAYEKMVDEDYLYDAVISGETVCDGYSNMLLLLFRLIGVDCCEVIGQDFEDFDQLSPEEQETAVGHTWVVAQIDGKFYNFDPTFEDTKDFVWGTDIAFFGFSDDLVNFPYMDLDELIPECTDSSLDFDYADLEVPSFTTTNDVMKIVALTKEKSEQGENTSLIVIRKPMSQSKYSELIFKYVLYAEGVRFVSASYAQLGECTLLWMTVEIPEASNENVEISP